MSLSSFGNFGTGSIARELVKDVLNVGRDLYSYRGKNVPKGKLIDRTMKAPRRSIKKRAFKPKTRAAKTASRKRKRTSTKKRKGSFKKARKPKVQKDLVRRKYDDHATMDKDQAAWLGVQHHASYTRMYDVLGEAVVKMILNKDKIYPKFYDQIVGDQVRSIKLFFKRMNTGNGQDEFHLDSGNEVTIGATDTFAGVATAVADRLQLRASTGNPVGGGYYLFKIQMHRRTETQNLTSQTFACEVKDMDIAKIRLTVSRAITLQNITKSDDAAVGQAGSITDINVNPLSGKKYKFSEPVPKLIDQLKTPLITAGFEKYTPNDAGATTVIGAIAEDDLLAHPVMATSLFSNCRGSSTISLAPGASKTERTTFSFNGTLKSFVLRNPIDANGNLYNYTVQPVGACTWFCFEQTMRHGNHSKVGLGVNIDTTMTCKVSPVYEKAMLRHYKQDTIAGL